MAGAGDINASDRFEEFYREYYPDEIGELAQHSPMESNSLIIDWQDLYEFAPDLAHDVRENPHQLLEDAEAALRLYDLPGDVSVGQLHVRIKNLPETTAIGAIRTDHHGSLIAVRGIVRKATAVQATITDAAFECQQCETVSRISQTGGEFQKPHECQRCGQTESFQINYDESEFVDSQTLTVEDPPGHLRSDDDLELLARIRSEDHRQWWQPRYTIGGDDRLSQLRNLINYNLEEGMQFTLRFRDVDGTYRGTVEAADLFNQVTLVQEVDGLGSEGELATGSGYLPRMMFTDVSKAIALTPEVTKDIVEFEIRD